MSSTPEDRRDGDAADATSYAPWTAQDAQRALDEAEYVEGRAEEEAPSEHVEVVEDIVVSTEDREDVGPEEIFFVHSAPGRAPGGARSVRGAGGAYGPGLAGVFGEGTPLGEATGLRLRPRKRWVALVAGLLGGAVGAQSFYTGRVFRGAFQAGLTVGTWVLALLTLGLLAPVAEIVTVAVWLWGGIEGARYLVARTGAYSVDALGGRLE